MKGVSFDCRWRERETLHERRATKQHGAEVAPRLSASNVERLANQRLHLGRDEVSDSLDADSLGVNAALWRRTSSF
ncbi:hypothetical protein TNCV_4273581 [Trichonephila clavipes]|nr:hypothetical protein TNCV_4273581 [Trichonephila clavipes]